MKEQQEQKPSRLESTPGVWGKWRVVGSLKMAWREDRHWPQDPMWEDLQSSGCEESLDNRMEEMEEKGLIWKASQNASHARLDSKGRKRGRKRRLFWTAELPVSPRLQMRILALHSILLKKGAF